MSETSTTQALALFEPSDAARLLRFGASTGHGASWFTVDDVPQLHTVGELSAFLSANSHLILVDLSVRIGASCELSTHDDGEACFALQSDSAAFDLLRRALDPEQANVAISAVASNRGHYVLLEGATARVFSTFDEVLRAGG